MNKNMKKGMYSVILLLVLAITFVMGQLYWIGSHNLYAKEASSIEEAKIALKNTNLSKEGKFSTKDFYGKYLPNTSFVLQYKGRVLYDQGYYMVYKTNYKTVYCVDPLSTAWAVNNENLKDPKNHEFAQFSEEQKIEVYKNMVTAQSFYEKTKDEKYLVAGQLLVWDSIGAKIVDHSSNLNDYMSEIESSTEQITDKEAKEAITPTKEDLNPTSETTKTDSKETEVDLNAKGGTGSNVLYYDTSGQDLVTPPSVDPIVETGEVTIDKTDNTQGEKLNNGDKVQYTLSIQNKTNMTKDITVTDKMDNPNFNVDKAGKVQINGQETGYTNQNLQEGIVIQQVAPGETITVTYEVTISLVEDYTPGTGISNKGTVCYEDETTKEEECSEDIDNIDINSNSSIKIDKTQTDESGDGIAQAGEKLTYDITIQNDGDTIEDVKVIDGLEDANFDLVKSAGNKVLFDGVDSGNTIEDLKEGIIVSAVQPGQVVHVTFDILVKDPLTMAEEGTTAVKNHADACYENDQTKEEECNGGDSEIPVDGFNVEKTVTDENGNGIADPSENLNYEIKVDNLSDKDKKYTVIDNIARKYVIVDENEKVRAEFSDGTTKEVGTVGELEGKGIEVTIPAGKTVKFKYSMKVVDEIDTTSENKFISNEVTVTPEDGDSQSDGAVIPVDPDAPMPKEDFAVVKNITDENGNKTNIGEPGDTLTFNFDVVNGTNEDKSFTVKDPMTDKNVDYASVMAAKLIKDSVTIPAEGNFKKPTEPTVGDLQKGITVDVKANSHIKFSFDAKVKDPLEDKTQKEINNVVTSCIEGTEDCVSGGGSIPVEENLNFDIKKQSYTDKEATIEQDGRATESEEITYKIEITNSSNTKGDFVLTDDLPNINFTIDEETKLTINGATSYTPSGAKVKDLKTGITFKDVEPGQTVSVIMTGKANDAFEKVDGKLVDLTNNATACYKDTKDKEICESDSDTLVIDPDKEPVDPSTPAVIKEATDEDGDGIAEPGEEITYNLIVTNNDAKEGTITVTDILKDENIDYDLSSEVNFDAGVTGATVSPTNPTEGDLQKGIKVQMPANTSIKLTYKGKVKDPLANTNALDVSNVATVCDEDGDCSDGGDNVPLDKKTLFDITKDVSVNGDPEETVVDETSALHYTIKVTNKGNEEIKNLLITDNDDRNIVVPNQDLIIKSEAGNKVNVTPSGAKTDDMMGNGITIETIAIGDTITIEYDASVIVSDLETKNKTLYNVATACTEEGLCHSDDAGVTTDPEVPVYPGNVGIVKNLTESVPDNVATPGEELTFTITLSNGEETDQKVKVTDKADDVNLEADTNQSLVINPEDAQISPSNPKLSDLQKGMDVTVPAKGKITIAYVTKVKNPLADTTQTQVSNLASSCNEKDECEFGGDDEDLEGHLGFDITKNATVNGEPSETTIAKGGDAIEYTIQLTNTQNRALKDIAFKDQIDENIIYTEADLEIKDASGNKVETTPASPKVSDLFTEEGIIVNSEVQPGETLTFTYGATLSNVVDGKEADDYFNIIEACTKNTTVKSSSHLDEEGNLCASDNADVSTKDVPGGDLSNNKVIKDQNGNGIAEPGEELTFEIIINNGSDIDQIATIKDELADVNVDYETVKDELITTTPDVGVLNKAGKAATIKDLKDGVTAKILSGQTVTLSFKAKVYNPLKDTTQSFVTNKSEVCDEDGNCSDNDGVIPLPDYAGFDINKDALVNGTEDPKEVSVKEGDVVNYTVQLINTQNKELKDITLTDTHDASLIFDPTAEVIITDSDSNVVETTPANPTLADLFGEGIKVAGPIQPGGTLNFNYDATIGTLTPEDNTHLTNVVTACTPNPLAGLTKSSASPDGKGNLCADDNAEVTTDKDKDPIPEDGFGVVKTILEGDPLTTEDDNGIADLGETLTFEVVINNSGEETKTIKATDLLADVNIEYTMTDKITVTPDPEAVSPNPATLTDLQKGMDVTVPAGQSVKLEYTGKVKDPLVNTEASFVANEITACDEEGECANGGDKKPLPDFVGFDVQKDVTEDETVDPTNDKLVESSEKLTYDLAVKNTMNTDLSNVKVTDKKDPNILVDPAQPLLLTSKQGFEIKTTPANPTYADLANGGVTIETIKQTDTVTIEYPAQMAAALDSISYNDFTNVMEGTMETPDGTISSSDSETVTKDGENPIYPDMGILKTVNEGDATTKDDDNGIAEPGETLNYNLVVTNNEKETANYKIQDNLIDPNIAYDLSSAVKVSDGVEVRAADDKTVIASPTLADLKDGIYITIPGKTSYTIDYSGVVQNPLKDALAQKVINIATICHKDNEDECNESGTELPLDKIPHFTVTKDVIEDPVVDSTNDLIVQDGEKVTYKITVENTGNDVLKDFTVTDSTDDNIVVTPGTALTIDPTSTQTDAVITPDVATVTTDDLFGTGVNIDKLEPGKNLILVFDAVITENPKDSDQITNYARACTNYVKPDTLVGGGEFVQPDGSLCADDTADVTFDPDGIDPEAGISVLKLATDTNSEGVTNGIADLGDIITYDVLVQNTGTEEKNFVLTDEVNDPNLDYDINGSGDTKDEKVIINPTESLVNAGTDTVNNLPKANGGIEVKIPAGGNVTFEYQARVKDPLVKTTNKYVTNVAEACQKDDPSLCGDGGSNVPLPDGKGVSIDKTVDKTEANVGDVLNYSIHFTNTGNMTTDMHIKDTFPSDYLELTAEELDREITFTDLATGKTYATTPATAKIGDLIGAEGYSNGIDILDIDPAAEFTITMQATIKKVFIDSMTEPYTGIITNHVEVCTKAKTNVAEDCDSSEASTTTDPDEKPITPDFGVSKTIKDPVNDQTASYPNNNDGIADEGERLKFTFTITNRSDIDAVYKMQDPMTDPNVDYASEMAQELLIENGGTFTTPEKPTVKDLQETGIDVSIPAGGQFTYSFYANVKRAEGNTNKNITNTVNTCDLESGDCASDDGYIPLPEYSRINLTKRYETDYTTNKTDQPDSPEGIDYVKKSGDQVRYIIELENIGTAVINNYTLQDDINNKFYSDNGTDLINITINDPILGVSSIDTYTINDLKAGINLNTELAPGATVTVSFAVTTTTAVEEILNPGEEIPNVVTACYDDVAGENQCSDAGTTTPVIPDGTNPPIVDPDNGFTIVKKIDDSKGNNNGIAEAGEAITMHLYVTNDLNEVDFFDPVVNSAHYNVTDAFDDPNFDYEGALTNSVAVNNAISSTPNPATVADLEKGIAAGIDLEIADGKTAEITFDVNVGNPIV